MFASSKRSTLQPKLFRAGMRGKILPSIQVKLEEDGEILVKGPNVMVGYYKNNEETALMFTTDGWLKTGDIENLPPTVFLKITDREERTL